MNLTVERTHLLRALGHAQSVVDRRAIVPILQNICLSAADDRLTIRASDMDMEIVETIPCEVALPGGTTLSAAIIHGLVSKIAEGAQIHLEPTDNGRIRAKSGRSRVDIPCLPAADYPVMTMADADVRFDIDGATLLAIIKRVSFLMASEVTRPYLCGVYLHVIGTALVAVATDGVRLGRAEIPVPEGAEDMAGTILPAKCVTQLIGALDDNPGIVTVELSANLIRFSAKDIMITSKLIGQAYPDYNRIVPAGNDKAIDIDRATLASLLDRASLFTHDKNNALVIHAADGEMTIKTADATTGDFSETMDVFYGGPALRIGMSCKDMLAVIGAMKSTGLRMVMGGTADPPLISDPDDGSTMYLINPLRV